MKWITLVFYFPDAYGELIALAKLLCSSGSMLRKFSKYLPEMPSPDKGVGLGPCP